MVLIVPLRAPPETVAEVRRATVREVRVAMQAATRGEKVKGWKLVEGRSVRVINDTETAIERLKAVGFSTEDITNRKLKGIVDLERLVGKKPLAATLDGLIVKPQGLPP